LKQRGWSQRDIAEALGASSVAVSRWMAEASRGGKDALLASPSPGPPRRLTDQDCLTLEELLAEGATSHGWPNNLWTAGRVAQVIQKHFGVEYHPGHVSRLLKHRLNWTCQRPELYHKDRDDKAIQLWVKETFPQILQASQARAAHLCLIDEAGFLLEPTVRRTYAPRGKTPIHRIGNPHDRISVIGAITVAPSRGGIGLVHGMLPDNQNYQGPTIVAFLRVLRTVVAGPLTILWDQIPIHECDAVKDYLTAERDVVAEPLPPYAPELNAADGIWRYVKYSRLPNYTPPGLDALRPKVVAELERLRKRPGLLKSFVRFTKLPIDL
jgi:transposase